MVIKNSIDVKLMGHLMRRAAFGAHALELEELAEKEELLQLFPLGPCRDLPVYQNMGDFVYR